MSWLAEKRITVSGGAGFFGSHVVRRLRSLGCRDIFVPRSADYDLRRMEDVIRMYEDARPEVIIHMAAKVSGIGYIKDRPADFLYDNLMMGIQTMEQARRYGSEKFVLISSASAYPKYAPVPISESDLWSGYPDEADASYGVAKRVLIFQAQVYRQQYGVNAISLLPVNLYGPGDEFDPASSRVIPALIRKCIDAKEGGQDYIEVWGSGAVSRDFLYVEDCADAVVLASERYDKAEPINIGSGREVAIRDLVEAIVGLTGFDGRIVWDRSRPDGQPRRCLDVINAEREFGFKARTPLEVGLRNTMQWYLEQRARGRVPAAPP